MIPKGIGLNFFLSGMLSISINICIERKNNLSRTSQSYCPSSKPLFIHKKNRDRLNKFVLILVLFQSRTFTPTFELH